MQLLSCTPANMHTHCIQDIHMLTLLSLPLRPVRCHSNGSLETTGRGTHRTQDSPTPLVLCVFVFIIHSALPILFTLAFLTLFIVPNPGVLLYSLDPLHITDTKHRRRAQFDVPNPFSFFGLKLRLKLKKPRKA